MTSSASSVTAQLVDAETGDVVRCLLDETAVSRLLRDAWLGDEVLYAYLLYVTRNTNVVALDPLLLQTPSTFKISQYPLRGRVAYLPLHMCGGTHWGLAVYDTSSSSIVVYDSYAHTYEYSSAALEENEPKLREMWYKITDSPLQQVHVAGSDLVHKQDDGFNCGVFACIYSERLSIGLSTKTEEPTRHFLQSTRARIYRCLTASFVVSLTIADGVVRLPRLFETTQYRLVFTEGAAEESNSVHMDATEEQSSSFITPKEHCHDSQQAKFTVDEVMLLQRMTFCEAKEVYFVKTCPEEDLPPTSDNQANTRGCNLSALVVFYTNCNGCFSAAVFRRSPARVRATVFDFESLSIEAPIRRHLLRVGEWFGFRKAGIRLSLSDVCADYGSDAAVVLSLCIVNHLKGVELRAPLTSTSIIEHRKCLYSASTFMPARYLPVDDSAAARMYLNYHISKKRDTVLVDLFLKNEDVAEENIRRQKRKLQTLVILYAGNRGDLCGAVVRKRCKTSVCLIFDFCTTEAKTSLLNDVIISHGHGKCQFVYPFNDTQLLRTENPAAVSYSILSTLDNHSEATTLCMQSIRSHATEIYTHLCAMFSGTGTAAAVPATTTTNAADAKPSTFIGTPNVLHLGPMNVLCSHCSAVSFRGEVKSLCCNGGTNIVPEHVLPLKKDVSLEWLWLEARSYEKLYSMLRALNNLVAFAGLSMNLSNFSTTCGQLPLVVQGSVDVGLCHLNPHSETASFAQLYICDDYNRRRSIKETMLQWKTKIEYRVIEKVIATLREINVIAQSYHSMYEVYLAEAAAAKLNDDDVPPTILMNLKHSREAPQSSLSSTHEGRLNIPQIENQVAAIYICRNGVLPSEDELNKGLRIFSRGGKSTAAHFNNNIDAMSYPLYFPRGEQSYVRESLRKRTGKRPASDISNEANVRGLAASSFPSDDDSEDELMDRPPAKFLSRGDFYRFLLSRRGNLLEHRFYGTGKLLSQYVIHAFSRIEADQLNAIARNTVELRSCKATALYSYLDQQLQEKGFKLGKLVNLPQNFIGSTQWYDNLYHNAMAVAQRVGKPDLFITFTGNQDWPEIRENLVTKFDSWITDPLLCVRVFRLRLQSLIKEIIDKKMFGEVVALQYSVEFQKRGMPHAHILVTLKEKLNTPDKIDAWISAELPQYPSRDDSDAAEKLQLFQLVTRFMVHRPCKTRPDFACRVKDPAFCDKHFPKPFREYTELTDDGYPLYRRRDNGRTAPVGRTKMNYVSNADVIPYNAYLLRKYMCHVNVECCCSITAFKYIYKYIYKGPDRILFELLRNEALLQQRARPGTNGDRCVDIDMRDVFLEARYLSHTEAGYRLLQFPMQYAMHTVISLSAHLPGQQPVYLKGALTREVRPTSKLLAYFSVVNTNEQARRMTWIEVAEQFRWTGKEYVELQRSGRRIARLWPVRPKMRELYALRKLLFHVRGASSYEYLRTVNGITYDTFMEAAEAAGYIESETEWEECLKSAAVLELPHAIRGLYAQILLYCHPTNPLRLWHNYKIAMRTRQRNTHVDKPDDVLDMLSLNHIESILTSNGSSLEDCGLKDVRDALLRDCGSYLASGRVSPDVDMPAENTAHPLTGEQERIVNAIVTAAALPKGVGNKLYYIDGKAGCGKTHTLNALIVHLKAVGKQVLATASTGIAATLLKGGRTAHSLFCLPIKQLHSSSIANVEPSSPTGQMLHSVDVIVWDEISMQSRFALECVDRLLRDVAVPSLTHVPFGGVTMVLGGDWCQFLPVIHGGTRQETIDAACRSSPLWEKFITFTLHQNLRLCNNEMGYARWLLSVGIGGNSQEDGDLLIPRCMCMSSENEIIDWIYTSDLLQDSSALAKAALLTVRNCDAEELNIKVLEKLPGKTVELTGIDTASVEEDGLDGLPCDNEEYFHKLMPAALPPHILRIKPGSILMLLRNLDVSSQLCNGTRLILVSITPDNRLLICKNLINGKPVFVHRMELDYTNERTGISFRRFQFPVRLAFCMTINKSQGQTFDKVGVILRTPSFAHGSTYVALSRCTSSSGIKVTRNWADGVPMVPTIRNVVYDEIVRL